MISAYKCAVFADKIAFIENEMESIERVVKFKLLDLKEDEEDMWGYEESYRQQLADLNDAEKRLAECDKRIHRLEHVVSKIELMREEAAIPSMLEEDDSVQVLGTCNVTFHQHVVENVEPEGLWNPNAEVNQDSEDETAENDIGEEMSENLLENLKKDGDENGEHGQPKGQEAKDGAEEETVDAVDTGDVAEEEITSTSVAAEAKESASAAFGGREQEGKGVLKKSKLTKKPKMLLKRGDKIELYSPTTRQVFPFTVSKVGEGEITVEQTVYMVTEKLVHIRMQGTELGPNRSKEENVDAKNWSHDGDAEIMAASLNALRDEEQGDIAQKSVKVKVLEEVD